MFEIFFLSINKALTLLPRKTSNLGSSENE